MAQFVVKDFEYMSSPMDAMTQLHVVRRLSPALGPIVKIVPFVSLFKDAAKSGVNPLEIIGASPAEAKESGASPYQDAANEAVEALGQALGSLNDEATDFIIASCLSLCQRRPAGKGETAWSDVWNKDAKRPQHRDINMGVMLLVTWNVLKAELAGFFPGASLMDSSA